MADKQTFKAVLEKHPAMEATGITIPFDVEAVFGAKRIPVRAEINGAHYRGSIVRMGGRFVLGIPKAFRKEAGIAAGDSIVVKIERDCEERIVEVPEDFAQELLKNGLLKAFGEMSYSHRKEHVRAIEEAKMSGTRLKRIAKAVEMIASRQKVNVRP